MEAFLASFGGFRSAVEAEFLKFLLREDTERRFLLPGCTFYEKYVEIVFETRKKIKSDEFMEVIKRWINYGPGGIENENQQNINAQ